MGEAYVFSFAVWIKQKPTSQRIGLSQSSFYNEIGKNGIQYKNFKWKVIYSNNFELYFNDGSENIANIALDHIEENFSNLSSNVGHQPFKKTKIFIYNSLIDMKQSNKL